VDDGLTLWETTWATFVGGFAASVVALAGVVIVEVVRARQERAREAGRAKEENARAERQARDANVARRRASRNAARSVLMELTGICRPLEQMVAGLGNRETMRFVRLAWDDQANRAALNDALTLDALLDVERAYRQLEAVEQRLNSGVHEFDSLYRAQLAASDWKFANHLLDTQIRPGIERLHRAIAELETYELAARGELEQAAEVLRSEQSRASPSES